MPSRAHPRENIALSSVLPDPVHLRMLTPDSRQLDSRLHSLARVMAWSWFNAVYPLMLRRVRVRQIMPDLARELFRLPVYLEQLAAYGFVKTDKVQPWHGCRTSRTKSGPTHVVDDSRYLQDLLQTGPETRRGDDCIDILSRPVNINDAA